MRLIPALLFSVAALVAGKRREVTAGLSILVVSATLNTAIVVGLIAWSRSMNTVPVAPTATAPALGPASFHSSAAHVTAQLPAGWAAAEGPTQLARPFTGLVAFNSWGQAGFWAPEITTANSAEYSLSTVLRQMPPGGAYIVLVELSGGPPPVPGSYEPEYQADDLSGLWQRTDCRSAVGGPDRPAFNKEGTLSIPGGLLPAQRHGRDSRSGEPTPGRVAV